jgi:hypothetical protein
MSVHLPADHDAGILRLSLICTAVIDACAFEPVGPAR